jgi:hypothetical protein
MFIKRFYLKLLQVYFKNCSFAKPTGDGLLMIFGYTEKTLPTVSEEVLSSCFNAMKDFPDMFTDDPMINFLTPSNLGFGIARGTACCLFSKKETIDYSGQLLNLAARLNDLARPRGIVIDGSFIESVIPASYRTQFKKKRAYIRSLAEESPREILCSTDVNLPVYAQNPLTLNQWIMETREISSSDLLKVEGVYFMQLTKEIYALEKTKLEFRYPNVTMPGYTKYYAYTSFEYLKDARGPRILITLDKAKSTLNEQKVPTDALVAFEFQYVPKLPDKNKRKKLVHK